MQALVPLVTFVRRTWSARAWWATSHLVIGAPIGLFTAAVLVVLAALTLTLAVTVVLAAVMLMQLIIFNGTFTSWQRSRFAALIDVQISPLPQQSRDQSVWRWAIAEARTGRTWRQFGYHVFAGVFGPGAAAAVVGAWSIGLLATGSFVLSEGLPDLLPADLDGVLARTALTGGGLALLFAAPWLARGLAAADAGLAHRLLGPNRRDELAMRVESLTASRAALVEAVDAERRRIERDIHDGTQQRLTSLALNLGIARATLSDLPAPALEAIVNAHDEAKQASAELREFVRGMYPAVLHDRGLDAALSGIVARAPLPVRLRVKVPGPVSAAVEAVAYFVVSEALTNVAKHAHASAVDVTVEQVGDRLHVTVHDDGRGGAVVGTGSGLRGLEQRTASVDGTLRLDSPAGGPTTIVADLPCAS
ncbi:sensor histidine kinase [Cryptosporangium aurantiacum]|uniref:histidine kinase n=1 Tax=Cryptosporangium aurantiacum TaxID=134849 RepID=A0A1M7RM56_9ACTN|nr:sensor histidine kinase [Cryptosporangium aurantiacum]SHN47182.1 Signal transduction histidine kinase [Cryptosporangium aurantiacum]